MAATPSKPSPSNRPMDSSNEAAAAAGAKEAPDAAAAPDSAVKTAPAPAPASEDSAATASAPPSADEKPPTYESVENSEFFLLAKRYLNEGKFEEAMSVIEQGIQGTQELLKRTTSLNDEEISVHEAMAPLHYQYGTILLYSIEESDQEVTTAGSAVSTAVVSGDGAAAATAAANDASAPAPEEAPAESQGPTAADVDEDMQIAWENFEAARVILEAMLTAPNAKVEKLELDLAQLCLREGDLQRMNGRNEAAIQDYESCLRLRKKSKFLDNYDRKIADVEYNLGMVYMMVASKDDEAAPSDEAPPTAKKEDDEKTKEAKRVMACSKSVYHYLECSKCFCGQIANICNADPSSITDVKQGDLDSEASKDSSLKFKTTGEEDAEMEIPKVASAKLATMRKRAKELVSNSDLSADKREEVEDLCQLLEEIQETIDEAETSSKGVHEVTSMKEQMAAMAAADGDIGEPKMEGNSTTTIGFGAASATTGDAAAAASSTASAAASAGAAVSEAPVRPMMVVKKKKKRAALEPAGEPDNKKPKPQAE